MSLQDFHLIVNEAIDNSIMKGDFLKTYYQQAANLNDSDQNIEFIFGEKIIYYQMGIAHLHSSMRINSRKR